MADLTGQRREEILSHLQNLVAPQVFNTWCRKLEFDRVDDDSVEVPVPNRFYQEWVEKELRAPIEQAFRKVFGHAPILNFTIRAQRDELPPVPTPAQPTATPVAPPPARTDLMLNPEYVFDRFVVGSSNRIAHAAALSVSENPGRFTNPLFIHGASGLGKTHLLQAACHAILERKPSTRIRYLTCEGFVNDFIGELRGGNVESFRGRYRKEDVLIVDDIHFLQGKQSSQEEFFHTFNALHMAHKQMIFSADAAPKHIPTLAERLTSRFQCGFVARVDPPTFEMRLAILKQRSDEKGHTIPDEVLTFVATRVQTNIRELEGAVNRILASAALTDRRLDLDLAHEALADIHDPAPTSVTPEQIIKLVARHYGKKTSDFKTRRWTKSTSLARHVAIYLCKHLTPLSLVEIGNAFGGKDHSTVLYAIRRVESRMEADPDFSREVEHLGRNLHPDV